MAQQQNTRTLRADAGGPRHRISRGLLSAVLAMAAAPALAGDDDLAPYPAAEAGYTRQVIRLDPQPDEDQRRLELRVGREMQVDCNRAMLSGSIEREIIAGWGYDYYRVESTGVVASTRMACPPGEPTRTEFVFIREAQPLRSYNSRLPVVVYVPEGLEVRYRIWSAEPDLHTARTE